MTVKKSKFIKFLSALLCFAMMLSFGISVMAETGGEDATPPATEGSSPAVDSDKTAYVKYEDYFVSSKYETASRFEGDLVASNNEIFIFKVRTIDALNNVTDSYEVFNAETGTKVLTISNEYEKNASIPQNEYSFEIVSAYDVNVAIVVTKTVYTKLSREDKENYKLPETAPDTIDVINDYIYDQSAEVYDVYGNLLADFDYVPHFYSYSAYADNRYVLELSDTTYVFDEEGKLVYSYNNITGLPLDECDAVTDKYYYFFANSYSFDNSDYIVVVDKEGKVVLEKKVYYDNEICLLQNGNIFVQEYKSIPEGYKGGVIYDGEYVEIKSYVINVETGKETYLPDFAYVVEDISNELVLGKEYTESYTSKAINTAEVYAINNGVVSDLESCVVFDNDMKFLVDLAPLHPQQNDIFSASALTGGYIYVELKNDIYGDYQGECETLYKGAILSPDGEITGYIKPEMEVGNGFVVSETAIYDYDFNVLYTYYDNREVAGVTADTVVLHSYNLSTVWDPYAWNEYDQSYTGAYVDKYIHRYYFVRYYEHNTYDEYGEIVETYTDFSEAGSVYGEYVRLEEIDDSYFVIYNGETGKYTIYNSKASSFLVTANDVNVYVGKDIAVITTYIDGHDIAYVAKAYN